MSVATDPAPPVTDKESLLYNIGYFEGEMTDAVRCLNATIKARRIAWCVLGFLCVAGCGLGWFVYGAASLMGTVSFAIVLLGCNLWMWKVLRNPLFSDMWIAARCSEMCRDKAGDHREFDPDAAVFELVMNNPVTGKDDDIRRKIMRKVRESIS